jgi:hypothetical protein
MCAIGNRFPIANNCTSWLTISVGLLQDVGRAELAKISAPLPLVKVYQLIQLLARSIWMERNFNELSVRCIF